MRIRELVLQGLRSFQTETRISFVDPTTRRVRPVTVLTGRPPSGAATVFEAIEALLSYAVDPRHPKALVAEALSDGLARLELELTPADLEQCYGQRLPTTTEPRVLRIEVGRQGLAPIPPVAEWSRFLACLAPRRATDTPFTNAGALSSQLLTAVARMHRGAELYGGLLYFPGSHVGDAASGHAGTGVPGDPGDGPGPRPAGQAWIVRTPMDGAGDPARRAAVASVPAYAAAGVYDVEPSFEDTQAIPLFGVLRERQRPGAVIAIEAPAIPAHPSAQRRAVARLRRLAQEWDAQVILTVGDDAVLDVFPESERVRVG